jgi:hypothetical protein
MLVHFKFNISYRPKDKTKYTKIFGGPALRISDIFEYFLITWNRKKEG